MTTIAPRLALALAFALMAGGTVAIPATAEAQAPTILVVTATATGAAHDQPAITALSDAGFAVTVVADETVTEADATGMDAVVITATTSASLVGTTFAATAVPVVNYEFGLHDDLGLTDNGSTNRGEQGTFRDLDIVDATHPITAGMATGTTRVFTKFSKLTWGVPGAEAEILATLPNNAARAAIFTYDIGALLADDTTAPAPRAALFIAGASDDKLNPTAITLLTNTVTWAVTPPGPPVNQPPQVEAGAPVFTPTTTAVLSATVSDDGLPGPAPTVTWTGPAGVSFDDPTSLTPTVTLPGPGTYTATITATDTELTATDTVDITVEDPNGPPKVLVVAATATGAAHDQPAITGLGDAGFAVTIVADETVTEADATGMDAVVITATASAGLVGTTFATTAVPVVNYEFGLHDDLALTDSGSANRGEQGSFRDLDIVDTTHPITAGMAVGTTRVFTKFGKLSWGVPGAEATTLATLPNNAARATIFTYDAGAMLANDTAAPARRAALFIAGASDDKLNPTAITLLTNTVTWGVFGMPPTATGSVDATSGSAPLTVNVDGTASFDPDGTIDEYAWDFGDGNTAATATAGHTYTAPGQFTVTLTVTDNSGGTDTTTVATIEVLVEPDWVASPQHFRAQVTVDAAGHDRTDRTVVVPIDFTSLFSGLGGTDPTFDPDSLRVAEVAGFGGIINPAVPFQFDPGPGYEPTNNATGELMVMLDGVTPAGTVRYFDVYFDTAGQGIAPATFTPLVDTITGGSDEGLAAIQLSTAIGDWWFELGGGGFSSLDDTDGNDWISYNAAAGADGQFRGLPNLTFPEGYFHPGGIGTSSSITASGPLRTTIDSTSDDNRYATRWQIHPHHAELTVTQANGDFWFLYEGTPGGSLDPATDTVVRPDGTSIAASDEFLGDLPGEEWAYFTDQATNRSLFVAHSTDDTVTDTYHDLDDSMTVFGFGRGATADPLLSATPDTFLVGLVDSTDFATTEPAIRSVIEPVTTSVGPVEPRVAGWIPPTAAAIVDPPTGSAPLDVAFDATSSFDDGSVVGFSWDFGDGSGGATSAVGNHVYASVGSYVATLTVTDNDGLTDTQTFVVVVGLAPLTRITDGLVALYEFEDPAGSTVADTSGTAAPTDLTVDDPANVTALLGGGLSINSPTRIASVGAATTINAAVGATDEVTVEAWFRTADITQNGPARLVGISSTPSQRNVMIGQGVFGTTGDRIEARLRTSTSDDNGKPALRSPAGSFGTDLTHVVLTRSAAGVTTLYIDGSEVTSAADSGDLSNWDSTMALVLANEADGSRPWLGELHLVALYDRAFSKADVCTNYGVGPAHGLGSGNVAPSVCFTVASPAEVLSVVGFDGSLSRDLDGAVVSYDWDFGDGTGTTSNQPTATHQYTTAGVYTVRLTATDDQGATAFDEVQLEVVPPTGGGRLRWTRLDSPDPLLPDPPRIGGFNDHQTASLVGDLDGDGDNDFVIASRKPPGPSIVWYEFIDATTGWVTHEIEQEVLRVEAGGALFDVDTDGDLDIVFGNDGTGNQIWWWENPTTLTTPPTGLWTRHLIKDSGDDKHHDLQFGDVDGDGDAELVYWNQDPDNKMFMAEIPADPTAGEWPATEIFSSILTSEGMALADIDGNGTDDIVGAGLWFDRQTDGTFVANNIDAAYAFSRTAVGQLIPGGRPEVVIDSGDAIGPLNWYEWDQTTDTWTSHELLPVSTYGHSLRLGDIDGDGNLDIFAAEMLSPFDPVVLENPTASMRIFFGDGAGNFDLDVVEFGIDNHESRIADLDNDGDLDILGKPYNVDSPGVNIWLNDGLNPFGQWDRVAVDDARPWTAIFVEHVDIDGDGNDDIVTGGWWYENPSPATGAWIRHDLGDPLWNMAAVADLDSDGDTDIIGTAWKTRDDSPNSDFSWAQNDGLGNFTVYPAVTTGDGPFLQGATVTQLEAGGPLELVLSWNTGAPGTKTIVIPDDLLSNPSQAPWATRTLSPLSGGEQIVPTDLDADGDTDLFMGNNWLRNDPGDVWTTVNIFDLRTGDPDRMVFADIDGDGDDDVVIGNGHDPVGELSWFERPVDPEATWTHHLIANLTNPQSVDVADIDGDGDFDVVVGEHDLDNPPQSELFIYENLGAGADWTAHSVYLGDEHHDGAQLVDVDSDGDLDIVSIGFLEDRVHVYYNRFSELSP